MTYLELVNGVLTRLREKKVASLDTNPFVSLIGALVNDAKQSVEDAWQWSQLRAIESIQVTPNQKNIILPNSSDNTYSIRDILNVQTGGYLKYVTQPWLRYWYSDSFNNPLSSGEPTYWTWGPVDNATGNKTLDILKPADTFYTLNVNRVTNQPMLVSPDDRLWVPYAPVLHLATALASRERGEIGGTPTSELFVMADRYLSDAIAYDSAKWTEEMDWTADDRLWNTNVGTA